MIQVLGGWMNPEEEQGKLPENQSTGIAESYGSASESMASNPVHKPEEIDDGMIGMVDHRGFNFALALAWLVAVAALLGAGYFWWLNSNLTGELKDKKAKKTAIQSQLELPANKAIEEEALNFKASVQVLADAKAKRYNYYNFLQNLYTKINKDVALTSISISAEGDVALAGETDTYRSIADQMLSLISWTELTSVELGSSSLKIEDGKATGAIFSISAKIAAKSEASQTATEGGI